MLRKLRSSYREAGVRRALRRQSKAWEELGGQRDDAFLRFQSHDPAAWFDYRERRAALTNSVAKIIRRTAALREVARDLALSDDDLSQAYRIVLRRSRRPFAIRPYHTPTALMLLPVWLEAVGALYISGCLDGEAEKLEEALISADTTYPLSVLEPLIFSGELVYGQLTA